MIEVRRQRLFRGTPERVWETLTDRAALQVWLGRTDLVPEVGRPFALEIDGPFGRRLHVEGEVLVVEPPSRLVLKWRHGDEDTRLVIRLEETDGGTRVVLRHRGFKGLMGMAIAALLTLRYRRALTRMSGGASRASLVAGAAVLSVAVVGLSLLLLGRPDTPTEVVIRPAPAPVASVSARRVSPEGRPVSVVPDAPPATASPVHPPAAHVAAGRDRAAVLEVLVELLASLAVQPHSAPLSDPDDLPVSNGLDESPRGTLVVSGPERPRALNPLTAQTPTDVWLESLIFDRLYHLSGTTALSHVVALDRVWLRRDGITVELRRDLRWHDGRRVSPEDVCFSWEAFSDPAYGSPHAARWRDRIASCEVRGRAVEIALNRVWTDPRLALDLPLLPRHVLLGEHQGSDGQAVFGFTPTGTGPLQARRGRKMARLEPADKGSRGTRIARVEWSGGVDPAVQVRQLAQGEVDAVVGISGAYLPQLRAANAALFPLSAKTLAIAYDSGGGPTAELGFRAALDGILEGSVDHGEQVPLRVGVGIGFPDDRALQITNTWTAAGLGVEIQRLRQDEDFDVALIEVDLLAHRHPLQAFVAPGPGNPFGFEMPRVRKALEEGGEERIGTWLRVADIIREERHYKILASSSSWLALGPRVRVDEVPRHPFLSFEDWWLTEP